MHKSHYPIYEVKNLGVTIEFTSDKKEADAAFSECNKPAVMLKLEAHGFKTVIERKGI